MDDTLSQKSEEKDTFTSDLKDNKNERTFYRPSTATNGKGHSDLPSSSIIEFRDQSIRRAETTKKEKDTQSDMLHVEGSEKAASKVSGKSSKSKNGPEIGEAYKDMWLKNGDERMPTNEFESKDLGNLQYPRTVLSYSKYMNGLLTFLLAAEMGQYLLPSENVIVYFMNPKFVRVVMYCHVASLYINFMAFIYNFIFNVCANSGHVQWNKLKTYMTIMIWSIAVLIARIIWEMKIHDYRWLVNMNNYNYEN